MYLFLFIYLLSIDRWHIFTWEMTKGEDEEESKEDGGGGEGRDDHYGDRSKGGLADRKCPYCNYLAPSSTYLTVHIRVHTGKSPYIMRLG